ncbi:WAT1-related protein At5g40240 [Ziziphus jujuba]|uniref:WAT1-related protein n=2 Tax=Ziziphus jujuba TaxID=326968 RepID=A0A6P3ZHJ2_ZIZJJ|nr:WAT1-related protein At5g40240 [Ziziphus jujuba]KAH7532546.1 hypothetical protein FEM48_Zijuj04G0031700 [Ziziphus jujuba var. spinosa]
MGWKFYKDILPFAAMIAVECITVGLKTIFKAASLVGMSYYVFMVYSYAIATLVLLPLPLIFGRRTDLPLFKLSLLYKFFLLGLIWFLSQLCGYSGIGYSSPTLASALSNLVPAFTFILAVIFRMEKLSIRRSSTQAKIMGTIISISGALVVLLYNGPVVFSTFSPSPSFQLESHSRTSETNWVIGGLLLTAEYILLSVWYIVQSQVMKEYPEELIVVLWCNFWATIISAPVCFIAERNMNAWILKPVIAIIATVLVGIFGSSFISFVHTWGLHLKGPVYISSFRPLSIAIAAVMGVIFLGDALYLGSIVGAMIISIGFYGVIWGKAKEEEMDVDGGLEPSSDAKAPLLAAAVLQS